MAEIRIIGNINSITNVERLREEDTNLISSKVYKNNFGTAEDYIEYFVYDAGQNLLNSDYNYLKYKSSTNVGLNIDGTINYLEIDPVEDLKTLGYASGEFITQYNFFRRKIGNISEGLFIKNISSDRTEIAIASTILSNIELETKTLELINEITAADYFKTYLADYGFNSQLVIVNVALDKSDENQYLILLKLYDPLPGELEEKSQLWIVDELIEPYIFNLDLDKLIIPDALPQLRGPNFSIETPDQNTVSTQYQNQNNTISGYQSLSSASYQQILSYITSQSIDINVDYNNFSNFIKFSSAESRIFGFYEKVKDIEYNKSIINTYTPKVATTASLITIINRASASINDTISNFDGFEYYLYFESSSLTSSLLYSITPYPKSNSLKPFNLFSTGSASASLWLSYATSSAQSYDNSNQEWLKNTITQYIVEDSNNTQYINFVNMVGHYFDNVWIYLKSVTDLYKSYNNLEDGVSKDLVYYALQSLGVKTYNSKEGDNLNSYLIGNNSGSVNFIDDFSYTSSYLNNIPTQELLADSFKRLYHNVSLLFKSKGTYYGLDSINNIFGVTSSILDVREYGGTLKNDYLKGYTTDKIRTSDLPISGNVLSFYTSLQLQETSSNLLRNPDYHRLDIAFSPQNQIDTRISSSIATLYPSFNIDEIIGDPRSNFSSSYPQLIATASRVFSSSFAYTFDYAGFTRLARYFDNTLFKTTKDYVPGRSNLSTGILLRSPQLERNKVKQTQPLFNTESVQEATYSIAEINEDNDYLYSYLPGDRAAFYTGQLSGSVPSINWYFEYTNPNPYLISATTVTLPTITGSAIYSFNNVDIFNHTDFNVLLNNVSSSILSSTRKKLEPIYNITGSNLAITRYSSDYYAELQDSYLTLQSYNLPRYNGVKLSSLYYNTYTSASSGYAGDTSYGKTAAVDKQVRKLGLFSQIVNNVYLPVRNNVALKYLVDEFGGLTDLNQRNKHWEEIQRTFISNEYLNVAQFDNQKYSNQKTTDGNKLIFDSGYVYYPIMYFAGCSADPKIYFENQNQASSYTITANNGPAPRFISGSGTPQFPVSSTGIINNIFNTEFDPDGVFNPGTISTSPTYSAAESGDYRVEATFDLNVSMPQGGNGTWVLKLLKDGVLQSYDEQSISVSSNTTASAQATILYSPSYTSITGSLVTSNKPILIGATNYPSGSSFYKWNYTLLTSSAYPAEPTCTFSGFGPWYSILAPFPESSVGIVCTFMNVFQPYDTFYLIPDFDTSPTPQTKTFSISKPITNPVSNVPQGGKLTLEFSQSYISTANYTASLSEGSLTIGSLAVITGYASTVCPYFDSSSISASSAAGINNIITFNSGISRFHNSGYRFVPNPLTGSINSLYSGSVNYGDVDYAFSIKPYDIIVTYLSDNTYVESRILQVSGSSTSLQLVLDNDLSTLYRNNLSSGSYQRFLILSRIEDETNAHLSFTKKIGQTSYGFVIPDNIHPDVLANIDTITENVKKRLIESGEIVA